MRADIFSCSDEAMLPHGGVKQSGWVRCDPTSHNQLEPRSYTNLALRAASTDNGAWRNSSRSRPSLTKNNDFMYVAAYQIQPQHSQSFTLRDRIEFSIQSLHLSHSWLVTFIPLPFIQPVVVRQKHHTPVVSSNLGRQETYQVGIHRRSIIYEGGRTSKVSAILGSQLSLSLP
jgi:hypothetical protein